MRALALFFAATPVAQVVSPKISNLLIRIGTTEELSGRLVHHPEVLRLEGWQWIYLAWGLPAVVMGVIVLFALTDRRPRPAGWRPTSARRSPPSSRPSGPRAARGRG